MHWTEIPNLSQSHMEAFFRDAMLPNSHLKHHGVIPRMDPRFISCHFEEATLEVAYDVQEWELNPENVMHGGMISTALDTTMGMLSHYYTQYQAPTVVTVTMNVSFLKPVSLGDTIHVICKLDSFGRTLTTVKAEVRMKKTDTPACIATATFMAVSG